MLRRMFRVLLVLWAGSLWSLLWVAPTVFKFQPDRHAAGLLAGRLFSIEAYIAVAVAFLAFMFPERHRYHLLYVSAAILSVSVWILRYPMSLAQTQGSAAGLSFGAWHGISAVLYLLACLSVVVVIYKDEYPHA